MSRDVLSQYQFAISDAEWEGKRAATVEATDAAGEYVGHLGTKYGTDAFEIGELEVVPEHRRRGVATHMLERIRAHMPGPVVHSDNLTGQGQDWAEAVERRR